MFSYEIYFDTILYNMLFIQCILIFFVFNGIAADRRIYGGSKARIGEFPYTVAVGYKRSNSKDMDIVCGGTLIHPKFVITAAHCLMNKDRDMVIMVGSLELDLTQGMWYDVKYQLVTSDWKRGTYSWDILLLVVKTPVELFPGVVDIAKLPDPNDPDPPPNAQVWITGWGLTKQKSEGRQLKKIQMNIVSDQECNNFWEADDSPRICCVSYIKQWGTCDGDSGGGMIYNGVVVGVLSYGTSNCSLNVPEVYSNVRIYVTWIKSMIKKYAISKSHFMLSRLYHNKYN